MSGSLATEIIGSSGRARCAAVSSDWPGIPERLLAVGGEDGTVAVFEIAR
jgi:hypothetical protein